jgi:hypothetical protein
VGEAAFAWLYKLSGRPEEGGAFSRMALRLVEWIIGVIGYLVYLRMKKELPVVDEENGEEAMPEETKAGTGESGVGAV